MIKIAIATDDNETVSDKLLQLARKFKIYGLDLERGVLLPLEVRDNVVSEKSDVDEELACRLLIERVLKDVSVVIASVCTRYTYYYLLSNNIQVLLVEEGTPIQLVEDYLRRVLEEFKQEAEETT